jgi:hypothetical protein
MSNTPLLNRILLVGYVLLTLAVGIAALIWPAARVIAYAPLRDALIPNVFLPTRAGMPVTLVVAAPPILQAWVNTNAKDFVQQNTLIRIEVTGLRGTDASRRLNTMTGSPDVWIAEADWARIAAGGIPFETQGPALAQDSLMWVAGTAQKDLAGNLRWQTVAQAASRNMQFRIAMPPVNSLEGMAACLSAAAEYHQQGQPTAAQINDPVFRNWLKDLLQAAPDRNRNPRDQLASRPPQADAGLILASDWRQLAQSSFIHQVPDYTVVFNYPYYIRSSWQDRQPDEAEAYRAAAQKFRDFLLSSGPQSMLSDYGLDRAGTRLTGQVSAPDEPTLRALQFCWQ